MSIKLSRSEYEEIRKDLYHVAYTSEQWLNTGVPITFTLEEDDCYYYLTVDVNDISDEDIEECNCRDAYEETEKFAENFGCRKCSSLEEVNFFVRQELPKRCEYVVAEGEVYGN